MTTRKKKRKRKTEATMKSPTRISLAAGLGLCSLLALFALAPAMADEGSAEPATEALFYVVKVTPSLVYLDGGSAHGVSQAQDFLIMRENVDRDYYVLIGEARVIRLFDEFCIAEIIAVEEGEEIALLQRAVSREAWDHLAAVAAAEGRDLVLMEPGADGMSSGPEGTRSVHLLGGLDRSKGIDLAPGRIPAGEVNDVSVGLRLAKTFGDRWRLNTTYRLAGEGLGRAGADVSQLSIELDLHLLLGRVGRVRPYLGTGLGVHLLTWDAADVLGDADSAKKLGLNAVGGVELPAGGDWTILLEVGNQQVLRWDDNIDVSNTRLYLGVGKHF